MIEFLDYDYDVEMLDAIPPEDATPCRRCEALLMIQSWVRLATSSAVTPELADRLDRVVMAARITALLDDEPTLQ
jgi:hypothetical protein